VIAPLVMCKRCETRVSTPLDGVRRPRNTPIWKHETALKCRSCRTPRFSPPVHMIRLTKEREITPYVWVHSEEDEIGGKRWATGLVDAWCSKRRRRMSVIGAETDSLGASRKRRE
jgi:hypothetical protein